VPAEERKGQLQNQHKINNTNYTNKHKPIQKNNKQNFYLCLKLKQKLAK